ncbi:glycosyltransferase family 4 protein [Bacillus sp. B190/17]|uniref:Glycosyltransferase family 4 protein n=1 Tax=Bacillus lumedeiriae TaxID=3058829 RepID=A0ABW8IBM5_9BACI
MMRIVQLITRMDETGGAQVHVRDLVSSLDRMGHELYIMAGSENVVCQSSTHHIPYFHIKHLHRSIHLIQDIKAFIEIRNKLKQLNPDLLALHSSKAGMIGRAAGWSLGIPTVFTAHGWSFTEGVSPRRRYFYALCEKLIGKLSAGVITVSQYDRELAEKYRIVRNEKITTIHNGVIDNHIHELSKPARHPPRMVMIARFAEPKQQQAVVEALNYMREFDWQMDFVGDGPLREAVEAHVNQLGLSDRIRFLGDRHNIEEILSQSQIFILLSKWEGLPLSILEAMRSGLPIVASDVGGVKETIKPSYNGFLIPRDNEKELINKLTFLINDPFIRKEMGDASRKLYLEKFTFERMLNETVDFYEKVIAP